MVVKYWGMKTLTKLRYFTETFLEEFYVLLYYCFLYGELGRFNLETTINKRIINFWIHLVNGPQNKDRLYCRIKGFPSLPNYSIKFA